MNKNPSSQINHQKLVAPFIKKLKRAAITGLLALGGFGLSACGNPAAVGLEMSRSSEKTNSGINKKEVPKTCPTNYEVIDEARRSIIGIDHHEKSNLLAYAESSENEGSDIRFISMKEGQITYLKKLGLKENVSKLKFSPDGKWLAAHQRSSWVVNLINVDSSDFSPITVKSATTINNIAFSPDSQSINLLYTTAEKEVRLMTKDLNNNFISDQKINTPDPTFAGSDLSKNQMANIYIAGNKGQLDLFDLEKQKKEVISLDSQGNSLRFTDSGHLAYTTVRRNENEYPIGIQYRVLDTRNMQTTLSKFFKTSVMLEFRLTPSEDGKSVALYRETAKDNTDELVVWHSEDGRLCKYEFPANQTSGHPVWIKMGNQLIFSEGNLLLILRF